MGSNLLLTLLALLLVLMNGFFVAAEFAIVKLRLTQAEELVKTSGLRGRVLFNIRSHLDAYLSACQLGITLSSLGLGWIGEPAFARLIEPVLIVLGVTSSEVVHIIAFTIAFATISYLHIVLGELAPKSVAIRKPQAVSLWTALPLFTFYWVMYPFIYILNGSANLLLKSMGVELATEGDDAHSVEELKQVLLASHHHGELGRDSADILSRAIELDELTAGDLMRPGAEMVMLDTGQGRADILETVRKHRYSRYPVYEENPDNLIGILHLKDLISSFEDSATPLDIKAVVKPALVIHDGVPAIHVLRDFRKGYTHFAIVVDEYGTIEGFVTMDHILEALMGNIQDEFSHGKPGWVRQKDGSFRGSGSLSIYSLERLLGAEVSAETEPDVNSVGGLIMQKLERIPRQGETVRFDGFQIEVKEMRGAKINMVVVKRG